MKKSAGDRILSIAALILAVASWPLSVFTWPGLVTAGAAVVCAVFHGRKYPGNRVMRAALICALVYLLVWLLFFIGMAFYRSILSLGGESFMAPEISK